LTGEKPPVRTALLELGTLDRELERYLEEETEILRAYREQDSGCVSYAAYQAGDRFFIKHAVTDRGVSRLRRAEAIYAAVTHRALPHLLNRFQTPAGIAHVYEWVPGDVLYDYVTMNGEAGRNDPTRAHARFRVLPVERILDSLDAIYDAHVQVLAAGFVAVDFYDGCILYDFARHQTWICDLDEYRPGPFVLEEERLPGSTRFMAPEEFERGAMIDQRTNVFTLGRTAIELLGDGNLHSDAWRGTEAMRKLLARATSPNRESRLPSVEAFVREWRAVRTTDKAS
jgi:serine/threonine protein kinase